MIIKLKPSLSVIALLSVNVECGKFAEPGLHFIAAGCWDSLSKYCIYWLNSTPDISKFDNFWIKHSTIIYHSYRSFLPPLNSVTVTSAAWLPRHFQRYWQALARVVSSFDLIPPPTITHINFRVHCRASLSQDGIRFIFFQEGGKMAEIEII